MYKDSAALAGFMASVGLSDGCKAVGLIVLLKEQDARGMPDDAPDAVFWNGVYGKVRGVTRQQLTEAYREYLKEEAREGARNRQRKSRNLSQKNVTLSRETSQKNVTNVTEKRDRMSQKNVTDVTQNVTKKRDSSPSPSSPSPAPFLPPLPPTPPITPYNPPNPNPVNPTPPPPRYAIQAAADADAGARAVCAQLDIDSAWEVSERARRATARRIADWIRASELPAAKYNTLYDLIYSSLDMGVSPDTIIAAALNDNGNSFSGDLSNAQCAALKNRGLL